MSCKHTKMLYLVPGVRFDPITIPGPIAQFTKLTYTCNSGFVVAGSISANTFELECVGLDTWETVTMPSCDVAQCSITPPATYTVDNAMIGKYINKMFNYVI